MNDQRCAIGVIGMAVMGQNLALNIARKGYPTAVFNRTTAVTEHFYRERVHGEPISPAMTLEDFVAFLEPPRKVLLMVKAGAAVDAFIEKLTSLMQKGDLVIDAGNSHFSDTNRRLAEAEKQGFLYLGTGVSGGEAGALHGPSIMPGGHERGYLLAGPILEQAAARVEDGACCAYLGPGSAGHFVKMVHNGIEYAFMQALAEGYDLLHKVGGLSTPRCADIFNDWSRRENLASYLTEITAAVLSRLDDDTGKPLVDLILDQAEQKGTGKWTSQTALDLGIPTPLIDQAVRVRSLSSFGETRSAMSALYPTPLPAASASPDQEEIVGDLEQALFLAQVCAFSEGFHLLQAASGEFGYHLDCATVARIWKGGCIVRSALLPHIQRAFSTLQPPLLVADPVLVPRVREALPALRKVITLAAQRGVPAPCLGAALFSLDCWGARFLPTNLIQAQRDYFGAHTFRRRDKEGVFHEKWEEIKGGET